MARRTLDQLATEARGVELATLVSELPAPADDYLYELKYDGYRIIAAKAGGAVRLISRRLLDWTPKFGDIAAAVSELDVREAIMDGEVCAIDERGVPSFQKLQGRLEKGARAQLVYFVFDLLWLDGKDIREHPIEERRARLAEIVERGHPDAIRYSSSTDEDPPRALRVACEVGFEGLIAKKKGSPYVARRTREWLKIKCTLRQEFAIVGYIPYLDTQDAAGALLLALHDEQGFYFTGKVGTGFDMETRIDLARKLDRYRVDKAPARGIPRLGDHVRFAKPRIVAEIAFSEWTEGGHARHPSFKGIRRDKKAVECVREVPVSNGGSR